MLNIFGNISNPLVRDMNFGFLNGVPTSITN